ncbi:hypothetical protein [Microbacterium sp. KRD174]
MGSGERGTNPFIGRLTDNIRQDAEAGHDGRPRRRLHHARHELALAVVERSGYSGSWHLVVAGTGLQGAVAASNTLKALTEMCDAPGVVAGRLLNRFVRSVRLERYADLFGWNG